MDSRPIFSNMQLGEDEEEVMCCNTGYVPDSDLQIKESLISNSKPNIYNKSLKLQSSDEIETLKSKI